MEIMKKIVIVAQFLLVIGIGLVFNACDENDRPLRQMARGRSVELDADTVQVFEGLTVTFQMLNADSLPVTNFKEGENITFRLVVTNSRKENVTLPNTRVMLGENVFHIYTSQGEDMGLPWDSRVCFGLANLVTSPGQSYQFLCSAFGGLEDPDKFNSASYYPGADPWGTWCVFFKTEYVRKPLSRGNYYTEFEINLNDEDPNPEDGIKNVSKGYKGVMCRKDFKIE
jgi:hypothetical protein